MLSLFTGVAYNAPCTIKTNLKRDESAKMIVTLNTHSMKNSIQLQRLQQ